MLWPESSPGAARHSLSQLLYTIKHKLPDLSFAATGETVQLADVGISLDVRSLQEAGRRDDAVTVTALYGGPFLAGCGDALTPELEIISDDIQRSISPVVQRAARSLSTEAQARLDWADLERYSRVLISIDPGDRQAYEQLMTSLVAQARVSEAEQTRAEAREFIDESLPLPLVNSDRTHELPAHPFVGRVEEFSALREWWDRAKSGGGGMFLVSGEAGIGKTRLCEQLLRLIAIQGGAQYHVQCFRNQRRLAYSCVAQLATEMKRVIQHVDDHAKEGMSLLLPELVPMPVEVRHQLAAMRAADQALLSAFASVVRATAAEHPTAIFIDDLQWSDGASLDLIASLAPQFASQAVLFLGAYRTDEPRTAQFDAFATLATGHLELGGLRRSECAALAKSVLSAVDGRTTRLNRTVAASDGNPLLLLEMLRPSSASIEVPGGPPAGVAALVRDKWTRLTVQARRLAQASAVLEQFAKPGLSRKVAGLGSREMLPALEELCTFGIIKPAVDSAVVFRHELIREVVYRNIPPLIRKTMHGRAVDALRVGGRAPAGVLSLHAYKARMRHIAYAEAMRAAREATELGAYVESAYYMTLARKAAPTRVEWRLAAEAKLEAAMYTGDISTASRIARVLLPGFMAESNERGVLTCEYCELQTDIARGTCSLPELEQRMAALVTRASRLDAGRLFVRAVRDLSLALLQSGKMTELAGLTLTTMQVEPQLTDPLRVDLLSTAAIAFTILGDADSAKAAAHSGVDAANQGTDALARATALASRGVVNMASARLDDAEADYERAVLLIRQSRLPILHGLTINYGVLLIERDRIAEALMLYSTPELAMRQWRVVCRANMALAYYEGRLTPQAEVEADRCIEAARQIGAEWARIAGLSIRGLVQLDRGDAQHGLADFAHVRDVYPNLRQCIWDPTPIVRYMCRCLAASDDHQTALDLISGEIDRVLPGNLFVAKKLQLERCRAMLNIDVEAAHALTKDVANFARSIGAHLLAKHAVALLDDIGLRVTH